MINRRTSTTDEDHHHHHHEETLKVRVLSLIRSDTHFVSGGHLFCHQRNREKQFLVNLTNSSKVPYEVTTLESRIPIH